MFTSKPGVTPTAASMPFLKPLTKDTVKFGNGGPPTDDPDAQRYYDILTEMVRQDLQQFRSPSEFEVTQDGKSVKVPQDYIDTPRFMRGANEDGVGQGQGQPGDQVGEVGQDGQPQPGQGPGQPGGPPQPGKPGEGEEGEGEEAGKGDGKGGADKWLPQISRSDIARSIGKDLELPNFKPKGANNIQRMEAIWDDISRKGTPGNLERRRTFIEAMKRSMAESGESFDPRSIQFQKADNRFFTYNERPIPKENAVIFYILDTSGSMSDKRKKMARDTNFYLSTFIQHMYGKINAELRNETPEDKNFGEGVEERFIIHDDKAEETTENKFYTTKRGGGTQFTPAYKELQRLIKEQYPPDKWNIYVFHYTDGDTFGEEDNNNAVNILDQLKQVGVNMYGYIQTEGSGSRFEETLRKKFKDDPFVRRAKMTTDSPEECKRAVHAMLGKNNVWQGNVRNSDEG